MASDALNVVEISVFNRTKMHISETIELEKA